MGYKDGQNSGLSAIGHQPRVGHVAGDSELEGRQASACGQQDPGTAGRRPEERPHSIPDTEAGDSSGISAPQRTYRHPRRLGTPDGGCALPTDSPHLMNEH
jgi:hypothetical protein